MSRRMPEPPAPRLAACCACVPTVRNPEGERDDFVYFHTAPNQPKSWNSGDNL